jgi:hypothetical protein
MTNWRSTSTITGGGNDDPVIPLDPDCKYCRGTGAVSTTFNTDIRFSYYGINQIATSLQLRPYYDGNEALDIEDIRWQSKIIVTPDGLWHEQRE